MVTFSNYPTSPKIWNMWFAQDGKHIQIVHVSIFAINFGAHMNIFYVIKVKILVLIKWLYTFTNKLEYVVHKLNFGSHLLADSNQTSKWSSNQSKSPSNQLWNQKVNKVFK